MDATARRRRGLYCCAACLVLTALVVGCDARASSNWNRPTVGPLRVAVGDAPPTPVYAAECGPDADVRSRLRQPAEFVFQGLTLREAIAKVSDKYSLPMQLDLQAIEADGIHVDKPVQFKTPPQSLRSALRAFLKNEQLTYCVHDGHVWVTTPAAIYSLRKSRVYPVEDLVYPANNPQATAEFTSLINLITSAVRASDWLVNGGTLGQIDGYEGNGVAALVITHDDEVLEEIEWLLANLRSARSKQVQEQQSLRDRSYTSEIRGTPAQLQGCGGYF